MDRKLKNLILLYNEIKQLNIKKDFFKVKHISLKKFQTLMNEYMKEVKIAKRNIDDFNESIKSLQNNFDEFIETTETVMDRIKEWLKTKPINVPINSEWNRQLAGKYKTKNKSKKTSWG